MHKFCRLRKYIFCFLKNQGREQYLFFVICEFVQSWGRQPNKKNPTKIQQIQQNVGFFVGFFEDPNTQQRPSMLGFFVGFLLGFSEELFDSCWVFGLFV